MNSNALLLSNWTKWLTNVKRLMWGKKRKKKGKKEINETGLIDTILIIIETMEIKNSCKKTKYRKK